MSENDINWLLNNGATQEQVDNVHTEEELIALMDFILSAPSSSSGSSSGSSNEGIGSGSSGADDPFNEEYDPSMQGQLIPDDEVLPGHM